MALLLYIPNDNEQLVIFYFIYFKFSVFTSFANLKIEYLSGKEIYNFFKIQFTRTIILPNIRLDEERTAPIS